ncbi:N-acetyltransferase B complex non catalytic subunit-domain-containing protein [Xylaria bambusicola]|uniref:N-acetyltransferase B complex non catalytic subunit-domain-containing protein n=1 Tax=Xylaria bambusicola TaxID=326684 RepID=UPI002008BEE4|nr:N-acetyltransferase B complex non catalytic subunit-domain-containing protein [Xylaria bambusicola]KAI0523907.1 N-acetyltransferase B complex non catalytic subunit-domain-containing protein [Xylaria bambusicola]
MTPPRILPLCRAAQLKHSVDIQLDRSFHEEQWTIAATLARQRHKATKDDYYKAIEIAARSRGDNAADITVGRETVQTMIDDNVIIKDVDTLDLYEFAIDGLSMDYAKTIGVLRSRLVKALPKDRSASLKCLDACMWNSDWDNAQEIAVSLNKNFPGDRSLLFQNILATFLVATSDHANENKKKLFANLAKAQIDRAFNLRPPTGKEQVPPSQIDIREDEVNLWIGIREKFGSPEENLKLLSLPNWGPLLFLERGFTDAFLLSIRLLTTNKQWEEVYRIVDTIFDKVIKIGNHTSGQGDEEDEAFTVPQQLDSTTISTPSDAPEAAVRKQYIMASREWLLWTSALNATRKLPQRAHLNVFLDKITKVFRVLTRNEYANPVYEQNYDQILLEIEFELAAIFTGSSQGELKQIDKIQCLLKFAKKYMKGSSCFTTLKGYLEVLSKEDLAQFVEALGTEHTEDAEGLTSFDNLILIALRLRVRFFQATSLQIGEECRFDHTVATNSADCETCLKSIAKCALESFSTGVRDENISRKAADETEDPLSNLAVLGSICLIKLAEAGHKNWQYMKESPLYHTDIQLYLQAVIWLDFYLRKTPKNNSLRMLLVKLYLKMGCVTRALHVWGSFDVKNTLLECLGTICLDRLASISPSHFMTGPNSSRAFADPFIRHFETALQKRYPDIVTKTLQNGSYAEIPNIIQLAQNQSRNCVQVLAVVELRRGQRLKANRNENPIQEEPLIGSLSPEFELQDFTDYAPLPQWAGPQSSPIQELAAYGPLPTNRRCHLSILAERFLDLVSYVQPKEFKPSKASQLLLADWHAAISSLGALHNNLDTLIFSEGCDEHNLTGPETWYFRIVTELTKLVKLILEAAAGLLPTSSAKTAREDILAIARRILSIIDYQTQDFLAVPDGIPARMHTLHGVAALHAMGMLRESAFAVKAAVGYISTALERQKAVDKTRNTSELAFISAETKKLSTAASSADTHMKERLKKLNENVHASGWVDRLEEWVFGDNAVASHAEDQNNYRENTGVFKRDVAEKLGGFIPSDAREIWAVDVADSWRDVVKGWGAVRFD